METLSSISKKDTKYKEVIKDCYLVKNAVILLGGRRGNEGEKERKKEGQKGEEEKGGMELECIEMRRGEKISLIELLSELVKEGMEMREEEEMKEVLMELEEEGNKHVEEEIEGEIEGEGEKREWEELSEKARNLVWVIEKMQNRREGKKSGTLKMMKKKAEEMEKKVEEERRGREEEKKRADEEARMKEEEKKKREQAEERLERMKKEMEIMGKEGRLHTPAPSPSNTEPITPIASSGITSLDGISVLFPHSPGIKREGNTIIHHGSNSFQNCFIGGEMISV